MLHPFVQKTLSGLDLSPERAPNPAQWRDFLVAESSDRMASQRLEALGQLTQGIFQGLNGPLQFVGDNARFVQDALAPLLRALAAFKAVVDRAAETRALPQPRELDELAGRYDLDFLANEMPVAAAHSLDGIERMCAVVKAMKTFGRRAEAEQRDADLNDAVLAALTLTHAELTASADVLTDLGDLPLVVCHQSDLAQVFLNLLFNAAQAVGEQASRGGERGQVVIRSFVQGDSAVVQVQDSGAGIAESVRPHIFEPFFTTRAPGQGSGQGLSLARAVVEEGHRGSLTFTSEPGRGTIFTVRLPIAGARSQPPAGSR